MLGVADDTVLVVGTRRRRRYRRRCPARELLSFKLPWLAGWRCLAGWLAAAWLAAAWLAAAWLAAAWLAGWPLLIIIINNIITILNNTITILNVFLKRESKFHRRL